MVYVDLPSGKDGIGPSHTISPSQAIDITAYSDHRPEARWVRTHADAIGHIVSTYYWGGTVAGQTSS